MEQTPPTLTPPPVDPPVETKSSRKWWYIGAAAIIIVVILPLLVAVIISLVSNKSDSGSGSGTNSRTSNLKDVALADNAKVDLSKLPDSRTLFFTMMQRTATKTAVSGTFAQADFSDPNSTAPETQVYEAQSLSWKNGQIAFNYAGLPWNPDDKLFQLKRCLNGVYATYAGYDAGKGWVSSEASGFKGATSPCSPAKASGMAEASIDGLLAAGISKNQAIVWVDELAASKDSGTGKSLFTFTSPKVVTLNNQQVIQVDFTINDVFDKKQCQAAGFCGMNVVQYALKAAQVDTDKVGYYHDGILDQAAQGTYYIDPSTLLPLQSSITTSAQNDPSNIYRRIFKFSTADLSHTSTALPATKPALISDFTAFDSGLAPPSM